MCFSFVLSSQTESAALRVREEIWGRGPAAGGLPLTLPQFPQQRHYCRFELDGSLLWRLLWWGLQTTSLTDPCLEAGHRDAH